MLPSSRYTISRQAPPARPSRTLEGLEQVIPPRVSLSPVRPLVHLDKPLPELPAKPLPDTPFMNGSTAWSDDSSTTADTLEDGDDDDDDDDDDEDDDDNKRYGRQSSVSTESYPVFVRSGSDELADYVDHPSVSTLDRASVEPNNKRERGTSSLALNTFLVEDHYRQHSPQWANRVGPNHYFREKKWDFFPELATPSVLQQNSPHIPQKSRKKDNGRLNLVTGFDFSKTRSRWTSCDSKGGFHDVRNSIRSYVQRRLSKNSVERAKSKQRPRRATAPSEYTPRYSPSQRTDPSTSDRSEHSTSTVPQTPLDVGEKMVQISVSPASSACSEEFVEKPKPIASQRKKQLAVPISPYQKYGAAIWDKSGKEKRISYRQSHHVRFPKYRKTITPKNKDVFVSSATPAPSQAARLQLQQSTRDCVKALQDGTSHVIVAIDGARKKMIGSKVDRRRTQLKSQIRLVGPVNPYTTYGADPWV